MKNIEIFYRLGLVPIKEITVVVAIGSAHDEITFEAAKFANGELKRSESFWSNKINESDVEGAFQNKFYLNIYF